MRKMANVPKIGNMIGRCVFQQTVRISMGANCAPRLIEIKDTVDRYSYVYIIQRSTSRYWEWCQL